MAELTFGCTGAHVVRYAATPTFALSLNISESTGVRLHAIALRCQVRIEPHRRRYTADEARRLHELFGDTRSWAEPAKPLQLATLTALVPGFTWRTEVELPVPSSYDLEVASARYLQVLEDGVIPLLLLFSGTVFVDHGHTYGVELIPWSLEVPFRMPVRVWHDVIEEHFPGSAWLRCSRQTLDALAEFKSAYALSTWDDTLSALLGVATMPWDPVDSYRAIGAPAWRDEAPGWTLRDTAPQPVLRDTVPEQWVPATEAFAAEATVPEGAVWEPADVGQQLDDAAPEPQDDGPEPREPQDDTPEPREPQDDAPEPAGAPEPEGAAPEGEAGAPESADAAVEDTATADPAAADTATEDTATADPAAADLAPAAEVVVPEPRESPADAAAPVRRRTSIRRRRTGAAERSG